MLVDHWDILGTTRPMPRFPTSSFGQGCFEILAALFAIALHVAKLNIKPFPVSLYSFAYSSCKAKYKALSQCLCREIVLGLPRTTNGKDYTFVVLDHFSKMSHFIPCGKRDVVSHVVTLCCREIRNYME